MKHKIKLGKVWFLIIVFLIYFFLLLFNLELFLSASKFFFNSLAKIIPAFIFVFMIMTIINYFLTPEKILNFSRKKGIKKWLFMVLSGILSTGPPFLWYPLLTKLKKQGLNPGLIATFLYSKALVISFLPLLIFYFSFKYMIVLYFVLAIAALVQGIIISRVMR
ncbi:MAG: hypothetical protein KJ646_01150 [Nanoarchaeota archaeon]|nr:hypothetical protein [Nanoarchaeota archaeon]MBU4116743.1 hypothetical protein [Nanoarchaeota archaeon]